MHNFLSILTSNPDNFRKYLYNRTARAFFHLYLCGMRLPYNKFSTLRLNSFGFFCFYLWLDKKNFGKIREFTSDPAGLYYNNSSVQRRAYCG